MNQCCYMRKPAGAGSPAGLTASTFVKYIFPLYIPFSKYNPLSLYTSVLKADCATSYPNVPQTGGNLGIRHSTVYSWVAVDELPFIKVEEKVMISKGDYMTFLEPQGRWEE